MSRVRIDWSSVTQNSSSIDAVVSFAEGMSLRKSEDLVWDPDVKAIFKKLRKLPVKQARSRARSWVTRSGYGHSCLVIGKSAAYLGGKRDR